MIKSQVYRLHVDGAARGNPGEAGVGAVLRDEAGNTVFRLSRYVGRATNNQAEYLGLILGLEEALAAGVQNLVVFTDSELMARQIRGQYRVKDEILKQYHTRVWGLLKSFKSFHMASIPRGENVEADRLANEGVAKKHKRTV